MTKLVIVCLLLAFVFLGDIIANEIGELIWQIGLRKDKLNFMKRRRPKRLRIQFR